MLRIMIAFILGGTFAWMTFSRPEEAEDPEGKGPRYRPYLNGWLMSGYMTTLLVGSLIVSGWRGWDEVSWGVITWILVAFLHISLYFILLLLAQPVSPGGKLRSAVAHAKLPLLGHELQHDNSAQVGDLPAPGVGGEVGSGMAGGRAGGAGMEDFLPSPVPPVAAPGGRRRCLTRRCWRCGRRK